MCPRNDGISTPLTISVGEERGFANCPAMLPTPTTGSVARVRQHGRHLQQHLEPLANRGGRDVVERLDAIAGLQEERASLAYLAERREQRPRLTREDERRQALQPLAHGRERVEVGPFRLLRGRAAPP